MNDQRRCAYCRHECEELFGLALLAVPCPATYRDAICGYRGNIAGCDKTMDGPRGCRMHGNAIRFGGETRGPGQMGNLFTFGLCYRCVSERPWLQPVRPD